MRHQQSAAQQRHVFQALVNPLLSGLAHRHRFIGQLKQAEPPGAIEAADGRAGSAGEGFDALGEVGVRVGLCCPPRRERDVAREPGRGGLASARQSGACVVLAVLVYNHTASQCG